jgi:hypothetical protein
MVISMKGTGRRAGSMGRVDSLNLIVVVGWLSGIMARR